MTIFGLSSLLRRMAEVRLAAVALVDLAFFHFFLIQGIADSYSVYASLTAAIRIGNMTTLLT